MRLLDVDFAVFSGHKVYGPTGIGVLFGKAEALDELPPVNFGGSMVQLVTMESATFMEPPAKFEAGTQAVTEAVGLGEALNWFRSIDRESKASHELALTKELLKISEIDGIRILGSSSLENRIGLVSFTIEGVHPHDVGQVLDNDGIAVRVGYHCARPVHARLGAHGSIRASVGLYNTTDEVVAFREALARVRPFFGIG
jgi:cysteine desulfurase/selenocysteine lyase